MPYYIKDPKRDHNFDMGGLVLGSTSQGWRPLEASLDLTARMHRSPAARFHLLGRGSLSFSLLRSLARWKSVRRGTQDP